MELSSTDNILADSTNDSKSSQRSVRRRWRPSESESFAKLSETTIAETTITSDEIEQSEKANGSESTLTRV